MHVWLALSNAIDVVRATKKDGHIVEAYRVSGGFNQQ
jgi:hypothetical protein